MHSEERTDSRLEDLEQEYANMQKNKVSRNPSSVSFDSA